MQTLITMVILCLAAQATAASPLRQCVENPRYFCDGKGHPVLLTGSHTWNNFQDIEISGALSPFDYGIYLDFLKSNNHNFFRLWVWEQAKWDTEHTVDVTFSPLPYRRTGPGRALDGEAKFDLRAFNDDFFHRLRSRVIEARKRGIYVSVMLFNGWSVDGKDLGGKNPWQGHPFNRANNINSIDGDPEGNGYGLASHSLKNPALIRLQEAYVGKVIDTLFDLENVLWEISNESPVGSEDWQYHMVKFIKSYESRKRVRHPVGMTVPYPGGNNQALIESPADWISPNEWWGKVSYKGEALQSNGEKVVIADTDHLWGVGGDYKWVWKCFLMGINPIFMDPYRVQELQNHRSKPDWELIRKNMGYVRMFSERIRLNDSVPSPNLVSSGYCLAHKGKEYLLYAPQRTQTKVDLSSNQGEFHLEWFNPVTGTSHDGGVIKGGGITSFTSPFANDAIMYLQGRKKP